MKRVAVFAHYDPKNCVEDYVVYYVKALSESVDHLIFVSDCDVLPEEAENVAPFVEKLILGRHGEYDFGSYKRGFQYLQENGFLEDADELIFANDSCFGPLYPLKPILDDVSEKKWDFWGMSENPRRGIQKGIFIYRAYSPHIQSYFLVFRPQIFLDAIFSDFINSIQKQESKGKIITRYEVGLSLLLHSHGFRSWAYMPNPLHKYSWDWEIAKYHIFLLKLNVFRFQMKKYRLNYYWKERMRLLTAYPVELIENCSRFHPVPSFLESPRRKVAFILCRLLHIIFPFFFGRYVPPNKSV